MGIDLAIAGVTGAVGQEFLKIIEERDFEFDSLRMMASSRSEGKKISFKGREYTVEDLSKADPAGIDIALFSAGGARSKEHAPRFAEAGAVVVDNSSAFRMDPEVPLVIPEINAEAAKDRPKGIIANPNCSTIIMLVPLWPIHRRARITRIRAATYQAVSGAGAKALAELENQTKAWARGEEIVPEVFPHRIAFNLFSHNSRIDETGYCEEETKMRNETMKIFSDETIGVSAMCVRVPVFRSHSEALFIETEDPLSPEEARDILSGAPGVRVVDDIEKNHFPMPIDASDQDLVLVGRIRRDTASDRGLTLFVAGDQLRKGAATNAVQIAEYVVNEKED